MTKLDGKTPDLAAGNIEQLRQIFPDVFEEGKIDFDKLKQVLGEYVDDEKERYNFTWNGKGKALRLGQLEERLSSLAFRQAVEQDMVAGILADAYQFSDEDLRRRRAESVQNVKKTNGRVSLEQRVGRAWEEGDEWQD